MRRGLKNKVSIILIIIIAIFTLLSYFFDQLVIRHEDNLRNSQIEFNNLNTKIANMNSVSMQLTNAADTTLVKIINFKRYRNYWFKNILLITNYDNFPKLQDKEIINSFNDSPKYINRLIKSRFIDFYLSLVGEINGNKKKLYNIYGWNMNLFPQYITKSDGKEYYDGPTVSYKDLFNQNIDLFNFKEYDIYLKIILNDKDKSEAINNFTIKHWSDLHKFTYILGNELNKFYKIPLDDSFLIDELISENETLRYDMMETIRTASTKKNYFILSSIICQITSLLFLLILFRRLINYKV